MKTYKIFISHEDRGFSERFEAKSLNEAKKKAKEKYPSSDWVAAEHMNKKTFA